MRSAVIAGLLIWMSAVVEMAWQTRIPQGALLLPTACAVLLWDRNAVSLAVSGLALLLDWIARPGVAPVSCVLLALVTMMFLTPASVSSELTGRRRRAGIPQAIQLTILTGFLCVGQELGRISIPALMTPQMIPDLMTPRLVPLLLMAVPTSAVISLLFYVADEFGLRRTVQRT